MGQEDLWKRVTLVLAVVVAVVACNADKRLIGDAGERLEDLGRSLQDASDDAAMAAPDDCATWDVTRVEQPVSWADEEPFTLPAGWEPFHYDNNNVYLRRCSP